VLCESDINPEPLLASGAAEQDTAEREPE
jgi:hypothetical protein